MRFFRGSNGRIFTTEDTEDTEELRGIGFSIFISSFVLGVLSVLCGEWF
jgi:hypothetical protein